MNALEWSGKFSHLMNEGLRGGVAPGHIILSLEMAKVDLITRQIMAARMADAHTIADSISSNPPDPKGN